MSKSLQNSVYVGALTMFWDRLFHSLITEGKKENLKLSTLVFSCLNLLTQFCRHNMPCPSHACSYHNKTTMVTSDYFVSCISLYLHGAYTQMKPPLFHSLVASIFCHIGF